MNFFKFAVAASTVLAAVAFTACDDSSSSANSDNPASSSSNDKVTYDCTVKDGVKVAYPKGGEEFKVGDTITVVFGADVEDSGYRILLKTDDGDIGMDMLEASFNPTVDGKTCNEMKVVISMDYLPEDVQLPLTEALIRVSPYNKSVKGANSGAFTVTE